MGQSCPSGTIGRGGRNNDVIDAADEETAGSIDTVSCGPGRQDVVIANENSEGVLVDQVSSDCEQITREPQPTA